jgi:TolB-like protein
LPFAFEDFVLDEGRRELRRGGDLVAVEPKVFDVLVHLVGNRERVVTKDDLINAVWDGRVVSDSALTSAVNAARVALGDSGDAQRLIKTLPRKGFRFVGEVREGAVVAGFEPATGAAPALPDKPSIAVLPFANLSGDPQQDYFADGVVEDITTSLSRIRWLFVIARNSSFAYKGRAVDIKQVGRDLGVRYVLEGSIRKFGNRIRVTGQLIDASSGISGGPFRAAGPDDRERRWRHRSPARAGGNGSCQPQANRAHGCL